MYQSNVPQMVTSVQNGRQDDVRVAIVAGDGGFIRRGCTAIAGNTMAEISGHINSNFKCHFT